MRREEKVLWRKKREEANSSTSISLALTKYVLKEEMGRERDCKWQNRSP